MSFDYREEVCGCCGNVFETSSSFSFSSDDNHKCYSCYESEGAEQKRIEALRPENIIRNDFMNLVLDWGVLKCNLGVHGELKTIFEREIWHGGSKMRIVLRYCEKCGFHDLVLIRS